MLKILQKIIAKQYEVSDKLLANTNLLQEICQIGYNVDGMSEAMPRWKYDIFGIWVKKLIKSEIGLIVVDGDVKIIEIKNSF